MERGGVSGEKGAEAREARSRGILKSTAVVGAMTMLSRVLGLVREQLMAHFFGIGALKSAFDVAFTIPNLFRRLFGEGALSSAFVPIFGETLNRQSRSEAFAYAGRVLALLAAFLGFAVAAAVAATFALEPLAEPGTRWFAIIPMMRVMLPYALLICLAAILSGMLNTFGKFAIPSFTPLLLNLVWIGAIFASVRIFDGEGDGREMDRLLAIAWAVVAAGLIQLLFLAPALWRLGFRLKVRMSGILRDSKIRRTLALMGPAAIGMGLIQINVCVDKFLALWAADYAPAALEYAERIVYLPLGVFATAFTTVLLPVFTGMAANGDKTAIGEESARALRNLAFVMIPCAAALVFLSRETIHLLYAFKDGVFANDPNATTLAARALACYAPGLAVFCVQKVLAPAYYAFQDVKTPLRISMFCLVLNVVLNVSSIILLPDGWKHTGIAGSTVICSGVNGALLVALVKRHGVKIPLAPVAAAAARFTAAAAPAVAAAWAVWTVLPEASGLVETGADGFPASKGAEVAAAALAAAAAAAVYLSVCAAMCRRDIASAMANMRRRRRSRA